MTFDVTTPMITLPIPLIADGTSNILACQLTREDMSASNARGWAIRAMKEVIERYEAMTVLIVSWLTATADRTICRSSTRCGQRLRRRRRCRPGSRLSLSAASAKRCWMRPPRSTSPADRATMAALALSAAWQSERRLTPKTDSPTLTQEIRARTAAAKLVRCAYRGCHQFTMIAKRSAPWTSAKLSLSSKR
jgi:hypothetical protein